MFYVVDASEFWRRVQRVEIPIFSELNGGWHEAPSLQAYFLAAVGPFFFKDLRRDTAEESSSRSGICDLKRFMRINKCTCHAINF